MKLLEIAGYPLLGAAALELLLGYILLRENPRRSPVQKAAAALSFFAAAFSSCTAVMYIRASLGMPYNLLVRANWIGWFTIPAALQFVYYLKDERSRIARLAAAVLYPFWTVMLGLSLFTDLVVTGEYRIVPYARHSGPLDAPARVIGTILILWIMAEVVRTRRAVSGDRKAQLNSFFIGMLIFGGGGVLLSGILPVVGVSIEPGFGSYFGLPWVALAFYAITRYGLFDVRIIISRSLTIAIESLVFSFIQLALFLLLAPTFGPAIAIMISLPLIGLLFFGTPLNRDVERWVARLVIKGKFDYQQILQKSSKAIVTMLNLNEILDYMMKILWTSLHVRNACLYLKGRDGKFLLRKNIGGPYGSFCRDSIPEDVGDQLREACGPVVRRELEGAETEGGNEGLIDCLRVLHAEIAVPLLYQGELKGVLALGQKGAREPYVQEDVELLDALASHAAVALENARLYETARQATASLAESESKFHALAQIIPVAIFIHQAGRIVFSNSEGESLTGYPLAELLAKNFQDFVRTKPAGASPVPDECTIVRKNGEERRVIISSGRVEYGGGSADISALFDITERSGAEGNPQ